MLAYYILIGASLAFAIWHKLKYSSLTQDRKTNFCLPCFFLILFLMLALRDISCGVDLANYQSTFSRIQAMTFGEVWSRYRVEQLFYFSNKLTALFSGDFRLFLALTAAATTLPLAVFYKRESDLPFLTAILFLTVAPFSMFFSGLRQAIAMIFTIPVWHLTKRKRLLWTAVVVFIAFLFHQSAIILLAIYPLYHLKITKKWLWVVVPALIVTFLFRDSLFVLLLSLMGSRYEDRYGLVTNTGAYTMLILFVLFAVFSYIVADEERMDQDTVAMRNFLIFSIFIQFFASLNTVAMRFNYYFLLFIPVLIPKVIRYAKRRYEEVAKLSYVVMFFFFTAYFFVNAYTGADIMHVYPYVPFWEG